MATMGEACEIRRRRESWILSLPGVTGLDLVERDGAALLQIFVRDRREVADGMRGLEDIDGVPFELIERTFEAH
jgi:hypothetical protein